MSESYADEYAKGKGSPAALLILIIPVVLIVLGFIYAVKNSKPSEIKPAETQFRGPQQARAADALKDTN